MPVSNRLGAEVQRDRVLSDEELRLVLLAADRLGYPFRADGQASRPYRR